MNAFIVAVLYYTTMLIILKTLINKKTTERELGYYILLAVPVVIMSSFVVYFTGMFVPGNIFIIFILSFLLYFVGGYNVVKAFSLALLSHLLTNGITTLAGLLVGFILSYFFTLPRIVYTFFNLPPLSPDNQLEMLLIYGAYFSFANFIMPILLGKWFVKLTLRYREKINESSNYQFMVANLLLLLVFLADNTVWTLASTDADTTVFLLWSILGGVVFVTPFFVGAVMHFNAAAKQRKIEQELAEQSMLEQYMTEITRQSEQMRKFKHDYQNLLASFGSFIDEGDINGLRRYFVEQIGSISSNITSQNLTLSSLEKIKYKEVKSILVNKVINAYGNEIPVIIEISDEILLTDINVNTASLVRMIGIIFDNAIEESISLQAHKQAAMITVTIFKDDESVTIAVANNCRDTVANLHVLKEVGYTTKGDGRGLGLSNLAEITEQEVAVFLETTINQGQFTQIITIGS